MDVAHKIQGKLERLLNRLKVLKIIKTFKLDIRFCKIEDNLKTNLIEINSVLKKCLKKIINKPRKAEIRNIISKLIRKKNLNGFSSGEEDENEKRVKNSYQRKEKLGEVSVHKISSYCHADDTPIQKTNCETSKLKHASEQLFSTKKSSSTNLELYLCETCGEVLNNALRWKTHKRKHITTLRFKCDKCLKTFLSKKKLRTHIEKHKIKDDKIERECHTEKSDLSERKLTEKNFIICFICKGSFQSKNLLTQHLVEEHNRSSVERVEKDNSTPNVNKFICDCGKVFSLSNSLRRHKILKHSSTVQTTIKKHGCTICKRLFAEKSKLNRHMLIHENSQFQCTVCSKEFNRSDALKRHESIFHNPQNKFSCSFCSKKFNLKYNRDIHEENIHRNVNSTIQCDHCGQKFRNKFTFRSHLKMHLEKPVTCTICDRSFYRKVYYQNHMKNQHFGISPFQKLFDSVTADLED